MSNNGKNKPKVQSNVINDKKANKIIKNATRDVQASAKILRDTEVIRKNSVTMKSKPSNKSITDQVEAFVRSICMPKEFPTIRWASQFTQKPSAVAEPFDIIQSNWGQTGTIPYPMITPNESLAVVFRHPTRSMIVYDQNSQNQNYAYGANFNTMQGVQQPATYALQAGVSVTPVIPNYTVQSGITYQPHGTVLFTGSCRGSNGSFVWLNDGDAWALTGISSTATTIFVSFERYNIHGLQKQQTTAQTLAAGGALNVSIKSPAANTAGYYSMSIQSGNSTSLSSLQLQIIGSSSCFKQLSLPNLTTNVTSLDGARILAASLKYTNTASVTDLGGEITMYQSADESWLSYLNSSSITQVLSQQSGACTIDMRNGGFGFLKPTEPSDFDYIDDFLIDTVNGYVSNSTFSVDDQKSFLVFCTSCSKPTGCQGFWTMCYGLEYLTSNAWMDVRQSSIMPQACAEGLELVKNIPQFHENPLHMGEILNSIKGFAKKAVSAVIKYGPTALKIAKTIGSVLL